MSAPVHRIRYGWAPSTLLGTRGMGPVESTLPESELASWDRLLRDHVWAASAEPGFTCLLEGEVGALLRKVTTVTDGRPGSETHVLLSRELTPRRALGLTSWEGWLAPTLEVLPWSSLAESAHHGLENVRARARALPSDRLAALFASLLSDPGKSYTVVGEADPLAVICALGDLLGHAPTFASDEADDSGARLPTAVFLRQAPVSPIAATRRRLVASAAGADPALHAFVTAIVAVYVADGVDGVVRFQRAKPPADLAEARAWAGATQLIPGILADVRQLPRLAATELDKLLHPEALDRVRAVAAATPSPDLGSVLGSKLPGPLAAILLREAITRVFADPTDDSLLYRLAEAGPFPVDLFGDLIPHDLDHVAYVAQAILAPADRRVLVDRIANTVAYPELIRWTRRQAMDDQVAAQTGYQVLCNRAGDASHLDVLELVAHGALVDVVRGFSSSACDAAWHLTRLLGALPKRALSEDVITGLVAHGDPVLVYVLDQIVTGKTKREVIDHEIRRAYYQAHQLEAPSTPGRGQWPWSSSPHPDPTDPRKPT